MPNVESSADFAEAERLKALGNAHYANGEFREAHRRFSEAIEKNPDNPVYYANRAAVLLGLNKNVEATDDCKKALDLDPKYAKAWGRMGKATQAMAVWDTSINAFQKALDCLPKDNLSKGERAAQIEYAEGIAKAKAMRANISTTATTIGNAHMPSGQMPWDKAAALTAKKAALSPKPSCVFIINYAYEDLKNAYACMADAKIISHPNGLEQYTAQPQLMRFLSNSVLTDERIFHVPGIPNFQAKLTKAVVFENNVLRGWVKGGGPTIIKKEALKRLETETWQTVRPAITVTVRSWIFYAFFRSNLAGQTVLAHELYANALDILDWGRRTFPDVPKDDRGVIYEDSFVRGVQRLYLDAMREDIAVSGTKSKFKHADLVNIAQDIIATVDADLPEVATKSQKLLFQTGHWYAYWLYPRADALATLGWCFLEQGNLCADSDPEKTKNFLVAAEYYLSATQGFPEDDEQYITYLRKHLDCLFAAKKPLKDTLPICKCIQKAIPQVLEIWGLLPGLGPRLRNDLQEVMDFERENTEKIAAGKLTMDSFVGMAPILAQPWKTVRKTDASGDSPFKVKEPGGTSRRSQTRRKKTNVI
ncbi:hypothetical protein DFP72DRAFT_916673 [Ephemerocybe angulata]|uniref:Uncharacterized protein n=1 Tax=Ephemerocybe angulata TaxID=980116 RepID=A0A8H6HMC2_9AGAR|nr:hypothetical protein DFP72DRAFT_916673 [Tulosesus angulatus]